MTVHKTWHRIKVHKAAHKTNHFQLSTLVINLMHFFYFAFSRKITVVKNISSEHNDSGSTRAAARPTTKPSHPRTSRCPAPPETLPDFASTNHQPLPYVQASPQHHQHACTLCPTIALPKLPWQSCHRLCLPGLRPSAWRPTRT